MSCHRPICTDDRLCFACKAKTISFSAKATPTRRADTVRIDEKEAGWDRDGDAYQRLRKRGLQPTHIDGSADLERHASDQLDVEFHTLREAMPDAGKHAVDVAKTQLRSGEWSVAR